ncbi:peptidase M50 [Pseudoprimorskyibacter insulae]|uniref:Peptide zinc metalloprotease protein YydH n=1 Tax=Pseudoprimorskyibacter insulae TaxID=1695997 RepID=A0A2R8AWB1_9RHOB|nr:peptidase M50 [Pseudoprimorskyibacter insulae]SPF80288.1 Putative peptide zinc metalloprotease protein YydH [Pseudoprimorskyibacter insulae]
MAFFSKSWYRVAPLRPRLHAHVRTYRHVYRGDEWYMVRDNQSGRFHRLSARTHAVLALMDGRRTVEEIWKLCADRMGDAQPSQDDLIGLMGALHNGDLLRAGGLPDFEELDHRARRQSRQELLGKVRNPLALRLPIWDPEPFLRRTYPFVGWLFGPLGALLWLMIVALGAGTALLHLPELRAAASTDLLSRGNLLLMALTYPVIKTLHELGHAYATKRWGGEVHEIGLMFLVFMPVPYVDASAAMAFPSKHRRAIVAAAGILIEVALASLAVLVWSAAAPGLLRDVALNMAVVGGVSTVLFNGNPLLRFDGYHVLSDLAEIPQLGARSNKYLVFLLKRHLCRIPDLESPVTAKGEARWFLIYGLAALVYRLLILWVICFFLIGNFLIFGVLAAVYSAATALVVPAGKALRFALFDAALIGRRLRTFVRIGALGTLAAWLLFFVPVPNASIATGLIWAERQDFGVRSATAGQITDFPYTGPVEVRAGQVLAQLDNPDLKATQILTKAQLAEAQARFDALPQDRRAERSIVQSQIDAGMERLASIDQQLSQLTIRAVRDGLWIPISGDDRVYRLLSRGDILGYLMQPEDLFVISIVPQTQVDRIVRDTQAIELRMPGTGALIPARMTRALPSAVAELPHPAFASVNGGRVLIDPTVSDALVPLQSQFAIELLPDAPLDQVFLGQRVDVKFRHSPQPLAVTLWTKTRQVFLRDLNL